MSRAIAPTRFVLTPGGIAREVASLRLGGGGAIAGWFAYTFSLGMLSVDHGAPYRRGKRVFMQAGAVYGLVIGARCGWLSESLEWSCPQSRPRRRPLFGPPERRRPPGVRPEHSPRA